ncbi:MAG: terminase small subunit [Kiritimatiellae bacterium]|nr:terminase small subunit [Kiritimatiellia bacterium]
MKNSKNTEKKLTPKRLLFIDKYFESNFNGTEAYLQAYPHVKKRETAQANASRLLLNAMVIAEVEQRQKEAREASKELVVKIREELEYLAFSRITNYLSFGPGGIVLKLTDDMPQEIVAAIEMVSESPTVGGGSNVKFKLASKEKNLELLMRHYGLIIEKGEHTGKDGAPLGEGWVKMKELIEDIQSRQRPGRLWNEGPKLETGDLD